MNIATSARNGLQPSEIVAQFLDAAPVPVESIAIGLGIRIENAVLGEISGKIERDDYGYKITINSADPYVRQRFTLAHEIGHYILHRDLIGDGIVDDAMYRSKLDSYLETQANQYAAFVLMPPALFKNFAGELQNNPVDLAKIFNVSRQAAEFRLKNLGLTP
jgi:Zn-dependent peptidase ImmA (M78 family)